MEVTKHNFKQALDEISALLKETDFISFDSELSGLGRSFGERNHDLDTPEERYTKAMKRVKEYGLIQIGMSLFRMCNKSKKYLSATYCFFLCGKADGSYRYDSSSMNFLAENGFDFNKLFLEGLPFMTLLNEEEIRKKREEKRKQEYESCCSPVKVKDVNGKSFLKDAIQRVSDSKVKGEPALFEGRSLNGFYRKVLFNNVAALHPMSLFLTVGGHERNIKVIHFESEEKKQMFLDNTWEQEHNEKVGFTHVVKAIIEANKPLVGHNIILDILHFVDKFVAPLPDLLDEFKKITTSNLPMVYDTKLLAKDPPFSASITNTALGCLYEELSSKFSPPEFDVEEGRKSYMIADTGQAHDGGFDAFMTGVCFATMLKTLEGQNWNRKNFMQSKHLKKYENRINFMGSYDIPYINLAKTDVIPDRSYIYHVTCPSNWTLLNVRHTFSKLKGYKVAWMSDTHLFVIPQDSVDICNAKTLLEDIRASCPPTVKVTMYDDFRRSSNDARRPPRSRGADVARPSSIALKRRSEAEEHHPGTEDGGHDASTDEAEASARNLKRLKSVGSELLSNMTLESPMVEDKATDPPTSNDDSPAQGAPSDVFRIPDVW